MNVGPSRAARASTTAKVPGRAGGGKGVEHLVHGCGGALAGEAGRGQSETLSNECSLAVPASKKSRV